MKPWPDKISRSAGKWSKTGSTLKTVFRGSVFCNNDRQGADRHPGEATGGESGNQGSGQTFGAADVSRRYPSITIAIISALCISLPLTAAILPEDRADILYHRYEGGGVTIHGPSILARKQVGKHVSLFGNLYQDSVTSASIDVVTQGSPYTEQRDEYRFGADYLYDNTTMNLTIVNSEESDYVADAYSFGVSHDMFGELTTVSLGYTRGSDEVGANSGDQTDIVGPVEHYRYRLDVSQVLTKSLVVGLGAELITDEGVTKSSSGRSNLNNPYRRVLIRKADNTFGFDQFESYPGTRTSQAIGFRSLYYLPYRASIGLQYRGFKDSWDIRANTIEVKYNQPIKRDWIFDLSYRGYSQTAASFYQDYFDADNLKEFMARDKELSKFTSQTIGFGASYEFGKKGWWIFDKGSVNLTYHRINFDYENFTDRRDDNITNSIPYSFTANVYTFFISGWY